MQLGMRAPIPPPTAVGRQAPVVACPKRGAAGGQRRQRRQSQQPAPSRLLAPACVHIRMQLAASGYRQGKGPSQACGQDRPSASEVDAERRRRRRRRGRRRRRQRARLAARNPAATWQLRAQALLPRPPRHHSPQQGYTFSCLSGSPRPVRLVRRVSSPECQAGNGIAFSLCTWPRTWPTPHTYPPLPANRRRTAGRAHAKYMQAKNVVVLLLPQLDSSKAEPLPMAAPFGGWELARQARRPLRAPFAAGAPRRPGS